MSHWAVIPAAGVGTRMGMAIPKQYLRLAGSTVLDCTIKQILIHSKISGVVVSLAEKDVWWPESNYFQDDRVFTVIGGADRAQSVLNGLAFLKERIASESWVLVHDAARPCVRSTDIDALIDTVVKHPVGGLLGMPVRDTMKRTNDSRSVYQTVDREHLWHAFTPQMFRLEALHRALVSALEQGALITDEASAMEHQGHSPVMVEGHGDNIKITRPADLELAEFYISQTAAMTRGKPSEWAAGMGFIET